MEMVNLTPHEVTIITEDNIIMIQPSGQIAKCEHQSECIGIFNGIKIYKTKYGAVTNMPEAKENTIYITSSIVANALKDSRNDIYVPFDFVRDDKGRIIGCRGLTQI